MTTLTEFEKAIQRLNEALLQPKNEFIRDSVIQRFEFCFELAWKSSKKVMGSQSIAPKVVIREMAAQNLISDPQVWFDYLEGRNLSSHTYKEDLAEQVYELAKKSLPDFQSLLINLKAIK
jgi:nucleotidyltransferase substrate binding protein (TIGR01987 family)